MASAFSRSSNASSMPDAELRSKPQVKDLRLGKVFAAIAVMEPESMPPLR